MSSRDLSVQQQLLDVVIVRRGRITCSRSSSESVPLVLASGTGAEMRRALGLAVFSGMLGVTFFGVFLTPVFFYLLRRHSDRA